MILKSLDFRPISCWAPVVFPVLLSALLLMALLTVHRVAADQSRPDDLLRETVSELIDELDRNRSKLEVDKAELYSLVNRLILPQLAVGKISRLILGAHFNGAILAQRERFTQAFMGLMIRTYATAMFEYSGQEEIVFEPLALDPAARTATVQTRILIPGQAPIPVDYAFLRFEDGQWRIYDVKIDGISLVLSYRRSYDQIIRSKGLEALINLLETKAADG